MKFYKMSKKAFTIIELLFVISIVGLLASIVLVWISSSRGKARDSKRIVEVSTLQKAVEFHYNDLNEYPEAADWIKIEENPVFAEAMKPYLPQIPKDPLYPKEEGGKIFSYQYKSTEDRQGYKIHVEMETETETETGEHASYEVFSGDGGKIVYGGGGGVGGGSPTNYALKFNGADDYIEVPDSDSLDITMEITLEAWVYPNTLSSNRENPIITKASGADWGVYSLVYNAMNRGVETKKFRFEINDGVGSGYEIYKQIFSSVNVDINHWYHVVATYNGTEQCIYVDEIQNCKVQGVGILTNNLSLQIGKQYWYYTPPQFVYWGGIIDEVRIYKRALDPGEVTEHHNGTFTDETGLVALWHFDEGSGNTTADASGNGNTGTLINNPQWVSGH